MKTLKSLQFILISIIFLTATPLFSQTVRPTSDYNMGSGINWMMLTKSGTLLVSTTDALMGIDPYTSSICFKNTDIHNIKKSNVHEIPGTPYLVVKANGIFTRGWVIDLISGKTLFDSKAEKWTTGVNSEHFIYPDKFLVEGGNSQSGGHQGAGLYDLTSGKLMHFFEYNLANAISGNPVILGDYIIIPGLRNISEYQISTGKRVWKDNLKNAFKLIANPKTNEVYAFEGKKDNSVVNKVDFKNGNMLWAKGHKLKGTIVETDFTSQGLVILTNFTVSGNNNLISDNKLIKKLRGNGSSRIYLLALNSGDNLWSKAPKAKSFINPFYVLDDGILYGESNGGINYLGFNGKSKWGNPVKTGPGIQVLSKVPKGILYISRTDADILNQNTGKSVFGRKIKYKNSAAVAAAYDPLHDNYLISCKDGVYALNGNGGKYKLLTKDTKFEGHEVPTHMSVSKNGILLSSSQNLTLLDFNGNILWHDYYKAPGRSTAGKIFAAFTAVSSMAMSAATGMSSAQQYVEFGSQSEEYKTASGMSAEFGSLASASFQSLSKRFRATKATKYDAFIMTSLSSHIGLVDIDKSTGKKIEEIPINNKKPEYVIDGSEGLLFYKSNNDNIESFKLKLTGSL